jgi:YHS domain-containing protein
MKTLTLIAGIILAANLTLRADDAKPAPDKLTTCPVSGDKLGEMDKPYVFTYQSQEVKLCCKSCKAKFDKDPEKYIATIRAADKADKN